MQQIKNIKRQIDTKEFELPDTVFISDIDAKVFQGIVLNALSKVEGVTLFEGNFIDNIFGRSGPEVGTGIQSEQDNANHSVSIKLELNIAYGLSIPEKTEEVQNRVVEEITRLTGLRVSSLHIVFRNIISGEQPDMKAYAEQLKKQHTPPRVIEAEEYSDDF